MERNSHAVASPKHSGPPSGYSTTHRAFEAAPDILLALTGLLGFGTLAVGVWLWSGM